MNRATRRAKFLLSLCLSLGVACSRAERRGPVASVCQSACKRLAGSENPSFDDSSRAECTRACLRDASLARTAGCGDEHRAYLSCVERQPDVAPSASASPAFALEHGIGLSVCIQQFVRYEQCTAPCREAGVVRTGARPLVRAGKTVSAQAELIATGCDPSEPLPARRSPAGAPCEHHSVCSATRCACPGRAYGYLARACVDGRCADAALACELVPEAVLHTPCAGQR